MDRPRWPFCWTVTFVCWILLMLTVTSGRAQFQHHDDHDEHSDDDDEIGNHPLDFDPILDVPIGCIYCVNVTTNDICNAFAIERACPTDETACYTHHVLDNRGATVSVSKSCAKPATCLSQVGCRRDKRTNQTVCVSCCESTAGYCNEDVASNHSSAVFQRASGERMVAFAAASSFRPSARWWTLYSLSFFIFTLALSSSSSPPCSQVSLTSRRRINSL